MKRILKNILCLALVSSAVFASCNKSDVVEVPDFRLSPYEDKTQVLLALGQDLQYTVESEFFQYSKTADEANEILAAPAFLINSNCSWRIEPVDGAVSWCHPFPEEGDKDGRMFFRLDRNNDQENDRSAYYKFVLNDGSKDIEVGGFIIVHQDKAVDFLKLAPADKVEVSVNGSKNVKITVKSNVPWTYELTPMEDYATLDLEWITDKTEIVEGAVTNTILLSVADNNGGTIRGANVVIKVPGNEDLNQTMPLTQYGDEATIEGFPVQWKASAGDAYYSKWPSSSNTIPTIDADNGSGTICFYRADVPGLNRTASTCDASGSNPRVNGAWPGDYFEFTADAPVSAGSLIKIQFEARISGTGCRHWRLEYLDGNDWKIAGMLRTLVAPDGTEVRYTQDMSPGGSADDFNKIISQVVKYENTTMEAKFRWYVASNINAKDGTQMTAPTKASARLDCSKAENEPCISCVAAGSEVILSGEITCSEDLLTFEGTPEASKTITVNATQDYTLISKSEWLHIDVMSGYANEEKTVSVTCDPSDLSVLRKGEIEIRSGANKKSITVVQSAAGQELKPFISLVGGNYVNIDATALSFNVTVQHNVDYEIVIPDDVDWISIEPIETKAMVEESVLVLYTSANVETEERSATITLVNEKEDLLVPLVITQGPAAPAGESVISWAFSAATMGSYTDAFVKNNSLPATKGTGYISWNNLEDNIALDVDSNKSKVIGKTGEPYVTGVWVGDYWEFAVPAVTASAGSTINFTGVTRSSAKGQKYWAMMYNVGGEDWKYVKETQTETETGTNAVYTHIMTSSNQTLSETIKLADAITNQTVRFRFICVANWQCSGSGALAAPNGGTHRWSVTAETTDGPVITIKEPEPVLRAKWLFHNDPSKDVYVETFGTLAGTFKNTAGDNGMYVDTNAPSVGSGRITFVQVDKTSFGGSTDPTYKVGGTGHPFVTGVWPGDYWLFTATDGKEYPAGTKLHISYLTRVSGAGQKFWTLEYWDGEAWQPTDALQTESETGKSVQYNFIAPTDNVMVDKTFTLAKACTQMQFRMICVANWNLKKTALEAPNSGTCRLASDASDLDGTSPVFEVVE